MIFQICLFCLQMFTLTNTHDQTQNTATELYKLCSGNLLGEAAAEIRKEKYFVI